MKLAEVTSINVNRTKTEMENSTVCLEVEWYQGVSSYRWGSRNRESTLLLQVSTQLSQVGTVLYVSGEESAQQIKLRAERLGDIDSSFISMQKPICRAFELRWSASNQIFSSSTLSRPLCLQISGVQGSVSQVREVTAELMQLAKTNNIAILS